MTERVTLTAPLDGDFAPLVRVVVGALADRAAFGFDAMDDLQLAVERLLAQAPAGGTVTLSFELDGGRITTRVGPLPEREVARALQAPRGGSTLPLSAILDTVVDAYGIDSVRGEDIVVRLDKLVEPA